MRVLERDLDNSKRQNLRILAFSSDLRKSCLLPYLGYLSMHSNCIGCISKKQSQHVQKQSEKKADIGIIL